MCSLLLDYFSRHILLIRMQNTCCPIPDSKKERKKGSVKIKPKHTPRREGGEKNKRTTRVISLERRAPVPSTACLSGVVWTGEAGSPAAVRKIKHSYANIIISSLGSVRVGGGGGGGGGDGMRENLDISISTTSFLHRPSRSRSGVCTIAPRLLFI